MEASRAPVPSVRLSKQCFWTRPENLLLADVQVTDRVKAWGKLCLDLRQPDNANADTGARQLPVRQAADSIDLPAHLIATWIACLAERVKLSEGVLFQWDLPGFYRHQREGLCSDRGKNWSGSGLYYIAPRKVLLKGNPIKEHIFLSILRRMCIK